MSKPIRNLVLAAVAGVAVMVVSAPAVSDAPYLVRHATLHGVDGPVYYSVVDGGYRPLAPVRSPSLLAGKAQGGGSLATN